MASDQDELLASIRALHARLGGEMAERWQRDLPFDELVFDRWERAKRLGFGDEASIYHNAYVLGEVSVGEGTWVGPFVMLDGSGAPITIGHHCSISAGVHIYTHDTVRWALTGGRAEPEKAPVRIGDCTYVGCQTTILRGATIGDHSVIGANSLVTDDVPPHSIAVGSPAEVRGQVVVDGDDVELVMERD
jgi:acetyltransferase-like isoleucine patch superfamily enzyme